MAGYISDDARKVTTHRLVEMKQRGEKISMLTSYDYTMAQIVDGAGVDVIITDEFGLEAYVAVLRDTPWSWSRYYKKYGNRSKCHYHFTFDNLDDITLEYVQDWAERNL